MQDQICQTIPGTADAVRSLLQGLTQMPWVARLDPDAQSNLEIVLAEVLNNIVEHAYATAAGPIRLCLWREPSGLCCEVTDRGHPMPGLKLPAGLPHALAPGDDLPEGGFGWFMIRSLTRDLIYRRADGQNQLSFTLIDEQYAP